MAEQQLASLRAELARLRADLHAHGERLRGWSLGSRCMPSELVREQERLGERFRELRRRFLQEHGRGA